MTWNTRSEFFRVAGGSATPLADKLTELGFGPLAPARTIISAPNNLTPRFRERSVTDAQLLTELMHNYYTFGRSHWSWTASSTSASKDGGLVKGNVNYGACGIFNDSFQFLATRVLGIEGVQKGNAGENVGTTWIQGNFVTMPTDVIDSQWIGNVMTHNYPFSALRMFKFSDHYFCNYHGIIFDATSNSTHQSTKTIAGLGLKHLPPDRAALYRGVGGQVYEVTEVSEHLAARPGLNLRDGGVWILINLGGDTLVASGQNRAFNRYMLTSQSAFSQSEVENYMLTTGRTSKKTYD